MIATFDLSAVLEAVQGDGEGVAHLTHPCVGESADAFGECVDGDTLDRVEVDGRGQRDRVERRVELDFAG